MRVYLTLPRASAPAWLRTVGWPGDEARLERALELLGENKFHVDLYIELAERVEPYLALGYDIPGHREAVEASRSLLERLIGAGVAAPEKMEAFLRWPGSASEVLPGAEWLVNISRQIEFKLVLHPKGGLEAKAYLFYQPRFILV